MMLSWRKDAQMLRISAGLVMCVTAGCGTVPAAASGSGAHMAVPAKTANHGGQPGASTAGAATAGSSSGCQSHASAGTREQTARTLVITLAGNARTYCVRVGDMLHVDLRGTAPDPWLRPLVSGNQARNRVSPGTDSTRRSPWCRVTMIRQEMSRPRPVP